MPLPVPMAPPSSATASTAASPTSSSMHMRSSPPTEDDETSLIEDATLVREEEAARQANLEAERVQQRKRGKKRAETKAERDGKARELDALLAKSAAFSDILTKKTQVLGRVGSSLDGKALCEHELQMARQPECMVGGTMRDYQLEGLTWMYEICAQGMSGILADEMGLGKTVQTIALIALLREKEGYLGPHLIVAPLSTLSNWLDEFEKWTPSIPVVMYHGDQRQREEIYQTRMARHMQGGRPTAKFPVVCTSYEMVLRDRHNLAKIQWEFIIIDEGHRMKNAEAKLFQHLRQFHSATRLLITGTPLQNNLKELWSLLHFLLPNIFSDWQAFESWFDFSDLDDEDSAHAFVSDAVKQELVRKMHVILQPLLLRRVKRDVAAYLPRKREYVLFAPMTRAQTELYNALKDAKVDARAFLEERAVQHLLELMRAQEEADGDKAVSTPRRESKRLLKKQPDDASPKDEAKDANKEAKHQHPPDTESQPSPQQTTLSLRGKPNAFSLLMKQPTNNPPPKRKAASTLPSTPAKAIKATPASAPDTPPRRRTRRTTTSYRAANADDDDALSDDAFEARLAAEWRAAQPMPVADTRTPHEIKLDEAIELAKKQVAHKKLGNPLAQLRLVCNSPHNFYNPFTLNLVRPSPSLITTSGKMALLDRLLTKLLATHHKILIFSQFTTQLDLLESYARLRAWPTCRIDGSVAQPHRRAQIAAFSTSPTHNIFLLSTRAGGQGINLAAADTVILYDSDFNPQQDLQAQDRAHRIGQTRPVLVFRLATRGTVEEALLLAAGAKRRLEKLVIRSKTRDAQLDDADLREVLTRDALVFKPSVDGGLSDHDLDVLCDRSDEAYERAAAGLGDAAGYRVVETGSDSIKMAGGGDELQV